MSSILNWFRSRSIATSVSFSNFQTLLLILTGLVALLFVAEAVRFLPVSADNMYPEAAGVLAAQRWAHGLPLYVDYRQPPYLITPFPPLWYSLLAAAAKLGLSDLNSLTLFGRVLSLASLFGLAGLGYRWNRQLGYTPRASLLTPAFYLSFPILIPWAFTARPDFLALFLGLGALYLAGLRSSTAWVGAAGVVAAMAFLVRHNAVAAPMAVVLWLVWSRRWKHATLFCAVWGFVVAAVLGAFQVSSHGLLLLNLSGATFGQFALTYIHDIAGRVLGTPGHGFITALFVFGLLGFIESWSNGDNRIRLISIYLGVSVALTIIGSAARGAAVNHYLEPALALAVLVPVGLAQLETGWKRGSPLTTLAVVFVLVLLLPSLDMRRWYAMHNRPDDLRALIPLVETRKVFTDVPYLAARTPTFELLEPASLMNTERAKGWSSAGVAETLKEKGYDLVILSDAVDRPYDPGARYPRYAHLDAALRNAIGENYALCFQVDTSFVNGESETRYVYAPLSADRHYGESNCPAAQKTSQFKQLHAAGAE